MVKQERAQATVATLLEATIAALEANGESGIRLDDILDATGVSRSSLYHHFGDRDGLIDAARMVLFTRNIEEDLRTLESALEQATTAEEFRQSMHAVIDATQDPRRRDSRLQRAYTIGASKARESLATALADAQRRITEGQTRFIQGAQLRGWVRRDLDAQALAVFIQAFTLGRTISDVDAKPLDPEVWSGFVRYVVDTAILTDET